MNPKNLPANKIPISEEMPPDIEPAGQTDTVPLAALEMPDDTEQMQPPAVGDEVNYQVTGKVTAINGDMAVIERTSINGHDVAETAADNPSEPDLQAEASGLDAKQFGA